MRLAITAFVLGVLLPASVSAQVTPFFAPAEPAGSIVVRLYPMENVTTSAARLVTFGVPFPRGSLTGARLSTVRVLRGGVELAAYVEALTPWRHITDRTIDGASVRVVRIQLFYEFAARYPAFEEIVVEWGSTERTRSIPSLANPRMGWHPVTAGSFVAADGVSEPDVYAVLPPAQLTKGALRPMRMAPMAAGVPEQRDDPQAMDDVERWPGFEEMDRASKNNLFTIVNEDDPRVTVANQIPYKTDAEPWLYDRAATMFVVYMRSGFLKPLREAVRNAEFFRTRLYPAGTTPANAVGCFRLRNPDPAGYIGPTGAMYASNESLAYQHWLTGDTLAEQWISLVVSCHESHADEEPSRWSPTLPGWTERHTAFRLQANIVAYEVLGSTEYRNRITTITEDFIWHQNGAGGLIPANRIDGALWHEMLQHEGAPASMMMASPWMSVLTIDAMVRAYAFTGDANIGHFVRRMGTFLDAASKRVQTTLYDVDGPIEEVDYITFIDGSTFAGDGTTPEHALEVAAGLAWADYFGRLLGQPHPRAAAAALTLYETFDIGVNYWIRPAAPPLGFAAFRVAPPRKWAWEHRVSGSMSWALQQTAVQPPSALRLIAIVGNTVSVAWTPPAEGTTPTGYVLEGGINPGQVLGSLPTGSTAPTFTFTAPTGRFYIRVHALAGGARSGASNEIPIAVNMPLPPTAPTNLRGLANASALALSWTNPSSGSAPTGIRVIVSGAVNTSLALPLAESFTYPAVPAGTYTFSVQAINSEGASESSPPVTLTFPGACPALPSAPEEFRAVKSGNTITVSWLPPARGVATSYTLSVFGAFTGTFSTTARQMSGTVGPGMYTLTVYAANPCGAGSSTAAQTIVIP